MTRLFIFARFHAREGKEKELAEALDEVIVPTRLEHGCRFADAYRSTRNPRLLFIHSSWRDEAAFETHATMPHTKLFLERVQALIDHPLDIDRAEQLPSRRKTSRIGFMDGMLHVPDDFNTMMADEIEEMFYGKSDE